MERVLGCERPPQRTEHSANAPEARPTCGGRKEAECSGRPPAAARLRPPPFVATRIGVPGLWAIQPRPNFWVQSECTDGHHAVDKVQKGCQSLGHPDGMCWWVGMGEQA